MPQTRLVELANKYFSETNNIDILDVACGKGIKLFDLYNSSNLSIKSLTGIDSGFDEINIPFPQDLNIGYERSVSHTKPLTKKLIKYVSIDEKEYIKSSPDKFDLIIFSNYLHFFCWEEVLIFISIARKILKEDGKIYILMANEGHSYKGDEDKTVLTDQKITDLASRFKLLDISKNEISSELLLN